MSQNPCLRDRRTVSELMSVPSDNTLRMRAAGQMSNDLQKSPQDTPRPRSKSDGTELLNSTFRSSAITQAMNHHMSEPSVIPAEQEQSFHKSMGRRGRPRSGSQTQRSSHCEDLSR